MLDTRIIEPIEETEWIIPIVIQDKKTTSEVLESIEGKEMYSFTDGFSSYHPRMLTRFIPNIVYR